MCRVETPYTHFNKDRSRSDGLQRHCRKCSSAIGNAWAKSNSAKVKARASDWYLANLERSHANGAAWRAANPEKHKASGAAWKKANPSRVAVHKFQARIKYQLDSYGRIFQDPSMMYKNKFAAANALGKRSMFEVSETQRLDALNIPYEYEQHVVNFTRPAESCRYLPDLVFPSGVIVELKGPFDSADRKKHLLVKKSHPDLEIRLVFMNSRNRIGTKSATTYAKWCDKNNIKWAHQHIPIEWTREPKNQRWLDAIEAASHVH